VATDRATSLSAAVGARVRGLREGRGLRQEDIARAARVFGVEWTRATVAALETGRRQLTPEELILIPRVLLLAGARTVPDGQPVSLPDLLGEAWITLTPAASARAGAIRSILRGDHAIAPQDWQAPRLRAEKKRRDTRLLVTLKQMTGKLEEATAAWTLMFPEAQPRSIPVGSFIAPAIEIQKAVGDARTDAAQKAARVLRVRPIVVAVAAQKLWGRGLEEERDQRITAEGPDASARRLQARRGHVTRALLSELRPVVEVAKHLRARP
jgi:transcriptional regulator with XRE-family HTH domain